MTHMVQCKKLKQELPGLARPPYPGEFGKKIYENISQQAWQMWLKQQTMLINEYRLSLIDPKAQTLLKEEMEKFLFGDGGQMPQGYVPPK
ncbi:MAG: oxidative damage protection protein [Gammaproteobacteria bacterium]|nr:oxidative damage protection protein [Gammaproteobacteria bacterium]